MTPNTITHNGMTITEDDIEETVTISGNTYIYRPTSKVGIFTYDGEKWSRPLTRDENVRVMCGKAGVTFYGIKANLDGEYCDWHKRTSEDEESHLDMQTPPAPKMVRCYDCGTPGNVDSRGKGYNCGCAAENPDE